MEWNLKNENMLLFIELQHSYIKPILAPTLNTYYELDIFEWLIVIVVELLLKQHLLVYLYMLTDIVEKRMRYRLKNCVGVVFINPKQHITS